MILYPAIDLKDGRAVRLNLTHERRAVSSQIVESLDSALEAARLAALGFKWLHVTDIDGRAAGINSMEHNWGALKAIIGTPDVFVQFSGAISDVKSVETALALGVARVVIDVAAIKDPFAIKDSCRLFPGRIAVALSAQNQVAMAKGWIRQRGPILALDLALMFEDYGVSTFVYSDGESEGGMGGMNIEAIADLAFALTTPVIAAGELSSLADLQALKAEEETGIGGVICGRALYDNRIDPAEALKIANTALNPTQMNM